MARVVAVFNVLYELKLDFVVAIRSNASLPREQTVRCNRWRKFKRVFSDGKLSFVIFEKLFWQAPHSTIELTTDPEMPKNATWCVMTHIEKLKYDQVGNLYGLRNCRVWLEAEQERVGMGRFSRHELCSD